MVGLGLSIPSTRLVRFNCFCVHAFFLWEPDGGIEDPIVNAYFKELI